MRSGNAKDGDRRRSKKIKSDGAEKIVFDPKARLEYLTGFEKRNKLKRQNAKEKLDKMEQEMKREKRKLKRHKLSKAVEEVVDEAKTQEELSERILKIEKYSKAEAREDKDAERRQKSQSLRTQYPDRIPVICEKLSSSDLPDLTAERFLVPGDFTVGNLTTVIRNRIKVGPEKSIFLFVSNSLLPAHQAVASVYQQRQDPDGFLYVLFSGENTFGQ